MLKIKDNVDLKELEKFGYQKIIYKNPLGSCVCYIKRSGFDCYVGQPIFDYVTKYSCGRCSGFSVRKHGYESPDFGDCIEINEEQENCIFGDIIKAGLVEKVE